MFRAWTVVYIAAVMFGCASPHHPQSAQQPPASQRQHPVTRDEALTIAVAYLHGQGQAAQVDLDTAKVSDSGEDWQIQFSLSLPRTVWRIPNVRIVAVQKATGLPRSIPLE